MILYSIFRKKNVKFLCKKIFFHWKLFLLHSYFIILLFIIILINDLSIYLFF